MFINERTLIVLAYFLFIVDFLSGGLTHLTGIDIKLSLAYKMFFLISCLIYMAEKNKIEFGISIIILSFSFLWAALINIRSTPEFSMLDFAELFKLFSTIFVFFTFSKFKSYDVLKFLNTMVLIVFATLILNVTLSYLGIGRFVYGDFGAIGFFQGGNALSGVIIIAATYSLVKAIRSSIFKFTLCILSWLSIAVLIGTKSAILSVFLISIVTVILFKPFKGFLLAFFIVCILMLFSMFAYEFIQSYGLYNRIQYFYQNDGLARVLLSGRDEFLSSAWYKFSNSDLSEVIFGMGVSGMRTLEKFTVEMDFFDILFRFGTLNLVIYLIVISMVFYKSKLFSKTDFDDESILKDVVIISTVFLLITSFFAGHIIFNGMVTFLWGILLACLRWNENHRKYS